MAVIHFRYGSRPNRKYPHQKKMFGGILGGHVYFQVGDFFYGFEPRDEKTFHYVPRSSFNAEYKKESLSVFTEKHIDQKVLSIDLCLNAEQEARLLSILETYHKSTPYDYAVTGMRCGASSYHILSMIGVFRNRTATECLLAIPYPKFLRKKMIQLATTRNLPMALKQGTQERTWETD